MPTLVLWGMRDTAMLPVLLDGLHDFVQDMRIERFADAGHAIIHEQPVAVANAIREFIAT